MISLSGWINLESYSVTPQKYIIGPQTWDRRFFKLRGSTLLKRSN